MPRLGSLVLRDASAPVQIVHVPTPHADDMVMPVALDTTTGDSVAFVADIGNPFPFGFSFPEWVLPLDDHIVRYGLDTTALRFAGGHGGVGSHQEFADFVAFVRSQLP